MKRFAVFLKYYLTDRKVLLTGALCQIALGVLIAGLDAALRTSPANLGYWTFLAMLLLLIIITIDIIRDYAYFRLLGNISNEDEYAELVNNVKTVHKNDKWFLKQIRRIIDLHENEMRQAREANELSLDFFSAWVHELKTPIAVLDLINQKNPKSISEEVNRELRRIEENLERGLFFIRGSSFDKDFVLQPVNVKNLVRECVKKHSKVFISKKMNINIEGPFLEIVSDRKWLGFILDQFMQNSLRYTPEGGTVSVSMSECANGPVLSFGDTGAGIVKEDLARVFERGFTGHNGRLYSGGTGLGLYLANLAAGKIGHILEISSEAGKGTTANIIFPPPENQLIQQMKKSAKVTKM